MVREIMDSGGLYGQRTPSHFPQYGSIFMASNLTRKECLERELFGLPSEYADFVMKVKTGMLLFLFDFQERNLYGVYQATTDGAMNIVPDAYKATSNRKFPAQVRFSTFWHCNPLPEHVFCDAIKENYFKRSKFKLGLSRDQVGRLLFLFEKRMLKIPGSPVQERQHQRSNRIEKSVVVTHPSSPVGERHQRSCQTEKSVVVTHPSSVENSESFTESTKESIPGKLDDLDASDHGTTAYLEDYIPLPSIEPEEIEDLSVGFLWDADFSALFSVAKVGGTDDEKQVNSDTRCHVQEWDSDSSKPASCSSGSYRSIAQVDHKKIEDSTDLQVQGLYSDKTRTSAFLRLSGLGKLLGEEHHCRSKVDNLGDILKEKDERHKMWKGKNSTERSSVFSRLSNAGKPLESQQKVTLPGEMKIKEVAEEFISQMLKRKSSSSVKNSEKDHDNFPENLCGRRLKKYSRRTSRLTRNSNLSSSVLDHSEGSSVCTINSTCHEGL